MIPNTSDLQQVGRSQDNITKTGILVLLNSLLQESRAQMDELQNLKWATCSTQRALYYPKWGTQSDALSLTVFQHWTASHDSTSRVMEVLVCCCLRNLVSGQHGRKW